MTAWLFGAALVVGGCAPGAGVRATPDHGASAGGYDVTLTGLDDPAAVTRLTVGGVAAWDLRVEGDALTVKVQGAPVPGDAEIVVTLGDEALVLRRRFAYDPPVDPLFDRMVALGASYTQGVQAGVPSNHAQLASPGAVLARQAGAWFGLPLLVPDLFPSIGPSDIGPAPACAIPDVVGFAAQGAVDVLPRLIDPDTGEIAYWPGRVDPDLVPSNVAVGGSFAAQVVTPPTDFAHTFVAHLVYDPYAPLGAPLSASQLELVEAADPTLVVSFDLVGNDLLAAVVDGPAIDPDAITPIADVRASLDVIVPRLAATGAEVYLANVPDPLVLGFAKQKLARMDPEAAEAAAAEVRAQVVAYHALLHVVTAPYDNVHVVDLASRVAEVADNGLVVGDDTIDMTVVGGFVSLDGLHLSDVGFAVLAQVFAEAIAESRGVALPPVDLAEVLATDPFAISTLAAQGLDVTACR